MKSGMPNTWRPEYKDNDIQKKERKKEDQGIGAKVI